MARSDWHDTMKIEANRVVIRLLPREVLEVHVTRPLTLRCLTGTLWVTQPHCNDDDLVPALSSAQLRTRGVAALQALGTAPLWLELWPTHALPRLHSPVRSRWASRSTQSANSRTSGLGSSLAHTSQ